MFGYFPFLSIKTSAVLEPRTGRFRGFAGFEYKAKDFKMCPRGQRRPQRPHLLTIVTYCTLKKKRMYEIRGPAFEIGYYLNNPEYFSEHVIESFVQKFLTVLEISSKIR